MDNVVSTKLTTGKGGPGIPRHSSVGKNGTFWMPPKSAPASFAEVMGSKKNPSKQTKSSQNNKTSHAGLPKVIPQVGGSRGNQSAKPSVGKFTNPAKSEMQFSQSKQGKVFKLARTVLKDGARAPQTANPLASSPSAFNPSSLFLTEKQTFNKASFLAYTKHAFYCKNSEGKEEKERRKGGGANHASARDYGITTDNQDESFDFQHRERSSPSDNLVLSFTSGILPRLSQISKDGYSAVRFSQDLPDGGKYSVKIEKFDDEVRFNFISPDSRIRDLLDETMDTILQTVRSSLSSDTKLTGEIFSSYRDL